MEIKISTAFNACKILAKAAGPFVIAQFDYAKFKYLDFKQKQVQTEAYKEFFLAEARNLSELKNDLIKSALTKQGLERIQAEQSLEFLNKKINQQIVYAKVPAHILYLESKKTDHQKDNAGLEDESTIEPSPTWLDRFNDLASKQNEEWRQDILAKAFAMEADKPGTIDLSTLLNIAQLDESTFKYFSLILDTCTKIYDIYWLKERDDHSCNIESDDGTVHQVGNLIYRLQHTGLLASDRGLGLNLKAGALCQFVYNGDVLAAIPPTAIHLNGISTSKTGSALAALCDMKPSKLGLELFADLEKFLTINNALVKKYRL
jgi:hypothetical protein